MAGQIHFYATPGDILPVLEFVEADRALVYVETGNRTESVFRSFARAADIPDLGIADAWSGIECTGYLVADRRRAVTVRTLVNDEGVTRYLVEELVNPGMLTLRAAGRWGGDVVLAGSVGTACGSDEAARLMKRFRAGFTKTFTKVKAYRVGPEALAMLKAGKRLTPSERGWERGDLRLD